MPFLLLLHNPPLLPCHPLNKTAYLDNKESVALEVTRVTARHVRLGSELMKGSQAKANRRQIPAQHKVELLVGKRMRSRTGLVDLSASVATLLLLLVVSHRLVLSLLVVLEGIVHFDGMAAFVHLPSPEQAQGGAEGRRWPGLVSGLEEDSLHSQGALEIRRHLDVRV